MVPQHARARRRPARALAARRHRHPRRRLRPGRQRRVARGSTATSSASTSPPTRSPSCGPAGPRPHRCRRASSRCPSPTRAYDVVVGLTILYTVPDDAPRRRASWRGCCRPGGAVLLVEPAFAALGPGARRHRARPRVATAAPGSAELATAAGLTVAALHLRVFLPRTARGHPRRASTGFATGATPRRLRRRQARARPRLRAARRARERRVARPPRPARWDLGRAARYLLTGAACGRGAARPAAPRARRGRTACGRSRRAGRTPTCRGPGGSGGRPPR